MSFLDVIADAVNAAGRRTARTSGEWQTWALSSENALRDAAIVVCDTVMAGAAETYLSDWNPTLHSLGQQVDALGGNTAAASDAVSGADSDSHRMLNQHGLATARLGSTLDRSIHG